MARRSANRSGRPRLHHGRGPAAPQAVARPRKAACDLLVATLSFQLFERRGRSGLARSASRALPFHCRQARRPHVHPHPAPNCDGLDAARSIGTEKQAILRRICARSVSRAHRTKCWCRVHFRDSFNCQPTGAAGCKISAPNAADKVHCITCAVIRGVRSVIEVFGGVYCTDIGLSIGTAPIVEAVAKPGASFRRQIDRRPA